MCAKGLKAQPCDEDELTLVKVEFCWVPFVLKEENALVLLIMIIMCFFVVLYGDNAYMVLLLLIDALVLVSSCVWYVDRSIGIYRACCLSCDRYSCVSCIYGALNWYLDGE